MVVKFKAKITLEKTKYYKRMYKAFEYRPKYKKIDWI